MISLELSGPKLSIAFESLALAAEEAGGIERYVDALKLKGELFAETLAAGRAREATLDELRAVCAWMSTVRRRIGQHIEPEGFAALREAIASLLDGATGDTDTRIGAFCAKFPDDRQHRWVRDLAAEILHHTDPERYPLMTRWMWDAQANTGVLREIWHGEEIDNMTIPVPSTYDTFVALREELAQFLAGQGVYRDVIHYVDLLAASVYSRYINEQGGSYLRADFSSEAAPMKHIHRLLGLDGIAEDGRTRLKAANGTAVVIEEIRTGS